jgi:hypothetical protein
MSTESIYAVARVILVGIGRFRLVTPGASGGTGAALGAAAYRAPPGPSESCPHALVVTGTVVVAQPPSPSR